MKKLIKLLCLMLVAATMLSVLVACKEEEPPKQDITHVDAPNVVAGIEKKNYNKDFTIVNPENDFYTDYYWAEDYETATSNIAVTNYEREVAIEEHLGIEIYHETLSQDAGVLFSTLERAHLSGTDEYQLAFTHPFVDLVSLMDGGHLLDLSEVPGISLDDEYYNNDIMQSVKYQGHMYLGSSSLILHTPYVMLFNKTMANDFDDVGEDTLYQHVRDNTWTLDQMYAYAKLTNISLNESLSDPMEGTYGFVCNIDTDMCAFVSASGYFHVSIDSDGVYQLRDFNETIFNIFKKFVTITDSAYYYGWKWFETEKAIRMDSGRAFFAAASTGHMIEQMTSSEVPLGVLPYPTIETGMTTKNQDWSGYFILPVTVKDQQMSGEVIELLSYYGETEIKHEFYDVLLGLRASKVPQDREMLELIFDNLVVEPALAFLNQGSADLSHIFYVVPFMIRDGEKAMASWYAKYYGPAKIQLDKVNGIE